MTTMTVIIIARIAHVVSSTIWAGFVIIAGFVLVNVPRGTRPAEARRIRQSAIGRAARVVAPAAVISLLSGLYLFSALHAGARSLTEIALAAGAASAVLSFFVGAIGSGRPERELEALDALSDAQSPAEALRSKALERRVVVSARATGALLLISVAAMAVARFL
jgi:uncharacterized membrane protein